MTRLAPLGDREVTRMVFRLSLFRRRGMTEAGAERLADRLALRDLERDDRHACVECAGFQHLPGTDRRACFHADPGFSATNPLLHRCARFTFQKPQ